MNKISKNFQGKSTYNGIIQATYKKYKKFINSENLPEFQINYVSNVDYYAQVDNSHKELILNINTYTILCKKSILPRILYHEFTHINDISIAQSLLKNNYMRMIYLYTEFHAAQIECIKELELIGNLEDEINLEDRFVNPIFSQKILEYINGKMKGYTERAYKFLDNPNINNYRNLKVSYMYYLGTSVFLESIFNKKIKQMPFLKIIDTDFDKIYDVLSKVDYRKFPTLQELSQIKSIETHTDIKALKQLKIS